MEPTWLQIFTTARKFGVGVAGVLAQVVVLGVLPEPWQTRAVATVALLTALGVYAIPNRQPAAPRELTVGRDPGLPL